MLLEEIKHQSLCAVTQALAEDEEYSKETIEGTRLDVVKNIKSTKNKPKNEG
jgi:hypothetical protein